MKEKERTYQAQILLVNSHDGRFVKGKASSFHNEPFCDISPYPYKQFLPYLNHNTSEYVVNFLAATQGELRLHHGNRTHEVNSHSTYSFFPATYNGKVFFESVEQLERCIAFHINVEHVRSFYTPLPLASKDFLNLDDLVAELQKKEITLHSPALSPVIQELHRCMLQLAQLPEDPIQQFTLNYLSDKVRREILFHFMKLLVPEKPRQFEWETEVGERQRIEEVCQFMENYREENLDLDDLCSMAAMSKSKFYDVFKKYKGVSPIKYYRNLKIEHACQLLRDFRLSIWEVGLRCGFQREDSFIRSFKQVYGISPTTFREHLR
jgi:AraC-like DNA-binding protein